MRIGILTFHAADNFGAVLQTYATQSYLEKAGHDVRVIDYRPESARKHYNRFGLRSGTAWVTAKKRLKFGSFRKKALHLSKNTHNDIASLAGSNQDLDAVIIGSDQVWNISSYRGYDRPFFEGISPEHNHRRISYAASVGSTVSFDPHEQEIREQLLKFDHLSVRDVVSREMVEKACGRIPTEVLDPVFLDDFEGVERPVPKLPEKYMAVYCLKRAEVFGQAVNAAKAKLQLPAISLGVLSPGADEGLIGIGPREWLYCIRNASYLVTNSFHGVCFCIKWKLPFFVVRMPGTDQQRLDDVLSRVGLSHRVIEGPDHVESAMDSPIDFTESEAKLAALRDQSTGFLAEALA
ncbi:polysaccharide pyruvyl transferase family protein [Algisphaera agarilytica]|uniref:Polysaccharide pyruvyl transferase domain-containing protein n=1 Tax=Algisphaera agarilytica TaxID=1385975 RepID=A0A7X0LLD2_9BACT|nr:polysaccharide pyruvyl transferase family protein [Algisphaera agarilytica]MBB6430784.1 hypothetical protein [Algisphaera agarilytica]